MANYAKLAGMTVGLVVGLGGGVLLAVMNPLIPSEDRTRLAPAPTTVQPVAETQDAAPAIVANDDQAVLKTAGKLQPAAGTAEEEPRKIGAANSVIQTGNASALEQPALGESDDEDVLVPQTDLADNPSHSSALQVPQGADGVAQKPAGDPRVKQPLIGLDDTAVMSGPDMSNSQTAMLDIPAQQDDATPLTQAQALPVVSAQAAPVVSTTPATPLVIAEPSVQISDVNIQPTSPKASGDSVIALPQTGDLDATGPTPQTMQPTPDVVASLPKVSQSQPAPEPKRKVNKSGTFKTGKAQLATTGAAGFASKKQPGSGVKFPKIGVQTALVTPETSADTQGKDEKPKGALQRNALAFTAGDTPLLSIVLIDIGDKGLPEKILQNLTIPASFALPADQENVAELAQSYTDAGFEILALSPRSVEMSLSGGLDQSQVDALIGKIFADMPQAIGLIDRRSADLQKDRKLAKSVVTSFSKTGHGLLTYAEGLNPVPRAAAEMNVAAGTIYRVLDGKGESSEVMIRFLNRAVLDARRNGHVIVLGTTAKETVATLVNWSLSPKARGVTLAPVSASLLTSID